MVAGVAIRPHIKTGTAGDSFYILTDDGTNGYLYLADSGGDTTVDKTEIVLVATFSGALMDGVVAANLVMG